MLLLVRSVRSDAGAVGRGWIVCIHGDIGRPGGDRRLLSIGDAGLSVGGAGAGQTLARRATRPVSATHSCAGMVPALRATASMGSPGTPQSATTASGRSGEHTSELQSLMSRSYA